MSPDIQPSLPTGPKEMLTRSVNNGFGRFGEHVQERIGMLSMRRFGAEIGAPVTPMGDLPADAQPSNYISMLYVMALPGDRALLLAPRVNDRQTPFDHLVVHSNGDQEQFQEFFAAADSPLRVADWQVLPGESVKASFFQNVHLFPVEGALIEEPTPEEANTLFKEALRLAIIRGLAEPPEVGAQAQVAFHPAFGPFGVTERRAS